MTAPEDLLRAVGLEVAGDLGHAADGAPSVVRDAEGRAWVLTVVPTGPHQDQVRTRAEQLARVAHPHLAVVGRCVDLADGSLAVLQGEVPGTDLADLRAARGAWSPGEVVTVVVPLAEALASLHDAGLAHGDVAPRAVVLTPQGRPVLVGAVAAGGHGGAGTAGLAAPERSGGATPAADVYALGRLGALLLAGADAVGGEGLGTLLAALTEACAIDPAHRPSAREVAGRVYAACPPVPVAVPDAAVLAGRTLRQLATPDAPTPDRTEGRTPAHPTAGAFGRGAVTARGGRHRQRRPVVPRLLAAIAGGALVTLGCVAVLAGRSGAPGPGGATLSPTPVVSARASQPAAWPQWSTDPVVAAVRLTRARAQALVDGDPALLARLTVPGSAAWRADRAAAPLVVARGGPGEAAVRIVEVAPVGPPGCGGPAGRPGGDAATVSSTTAAGACTPVVRVAVVSDAGVVPEAGVAPEAGAAGEAGAGGEAGATARSAVVLVLRLTAAGWRVSAVEPYAP